MKNKYFPMLCVFVFMLVACSGNNQTATTPVQPHNNVVVMPTITYTLTPISSETPLPRITATASLPLTATTTPTLTATPKNLALADNGYDFANVQVSYPKPDKAVISFDYRIDKYNPEHIGIGLSLPSLCPDFRITRFPETIFRIPRGPLTGKGQVEYRIKSQGECNVPFFYLAIYSPFNNGDWPRPDQAIYQERIDLPLKIIGSESVPDFGKTMVVRNFAFHTTGAWTGELTFEYVLSPEFFAKVKGTQFHLGGNSNILYCDLNVQGRPITEAEGTYVINIDMNRYSHDDSWAVNCSNKLDKYSQLVFNQITLSVMESNDQYINFPITLKKQP